MTYSVFGGKPYLTSQQCIRINLSFQSDLNTRSNGDLFDVHAVGASGQRGLFRNEMRQRICHHPPRRIVY